MKSIAMEFSSFIDTITMARDGHNRDEWQVTVITEREEMDL